eukprot:414489-Pyramimonas_sp.AAC.1
MRGTGGTDVVDIFYINAYIIMGAECGGAGVHAFWAGDNRRKGAWMGGRNDVIDAISNNN